MKKKILRKLIKISNSVLGKEKTDEIIDNTVNKVLKEINPKEKKKSE